MNEVSQCFKASSTLTSALLHISSHWLERVPPHSHCQSTGHSHPTSAMSLASQSCPVPSLYHTATKVILLNQVSGCATPPLKSAPWG